MTHHSSHPHVKVSKFEHAKQKIQQWLKDHPLSKKTKYALVALGLVLIYIMSRGENGLVYEYAVVEKGDVIQEVLVSGTVKPVESVDLGFEVGGKIKEILVEVGKEVEKRDILATLELGEFQGDLESAKAGVARAAAEVRQASAILSTEQALLDEAKKGTRKEELAVIQAQVTSATASVKEAKRNLENTEAKAQADLSERLESIRSGLQSSVTIAKSSLMELTVLQYDNFSTSSLEGTKIGEAKGKAIFNLFSITNAENWNLESIGELKGGLYGEIQSLSASAPEEQILELLNRYQIALDSIKTALNAIPLSSELDSTERATLQNEKNAINNQSSTMISLEKGFEALKANNEKSIQDAKASLSSAETLLEVRQKELKLAQAGSSAESLRAQSARVEQQRSLLAIRNAELAQAQAAVKNVEAQIQKRILSAPFAGIISAQEAKEGEILPPNQTFIKLITENDLEIEANVPELSIAKIKKDSPAKITFDAYGEEVIFEGVVTDVDPAETIVDGLPTYKVTVALLSPDDRILPGMTTNILIRGSEVKEAVRIPTRALLKVEGKNIVKVLPDNFEKAKSPTFEERRVEVGLRGSDGYIEILDGIKEGERVLISAKEATE